MRSRIARKTIAVSAFALMASAGACSFLRSLDDLGNGVRTDDGGGDVVITTGDASNDASRDSDAPVVCGPEIDLTSDEKNCGTCGYACLDTDKCELGSCLFAPTTNETAEVALGGEWLVYTDGNAIWARKTAGGARLSVVETGATIVRLATDGVYAYWTSDGSNGGVFRCDLPNCAAGRVTIATAQDYPRGITLDGKGRVYWAVGGGYYRCNASPAPARPVGQIRSANIDGTDKQDLLVPTDAGDSTTDVTQVFLHAPYLYWSNDACTYTGGGQAHSHIWRQLLDGGGGASQVLATSGSGCHFNDLDYACEYTAVSTLPQVPASGEKKWVGEPNLQFPRVATDGTRVFWTDIDSAVADASVGARNVYGIVKTAEPKTTKPSLLWTKPKTNRGLRGIVVDDRTIYFADPDDKKVRAIAK